MHAAAVPGVFSSLGFAMPGKRSMEYFLRKAAESDRVLVMIFLDGGNDGLNTVVPLNRMSELNSVRSRVVLNENEILPLAQSEVGLHPVMGDLKALYDENKFQIIQNVGYDNPDFSHFRSTDIWMSGSDANQVVGSGWMGRHLENTFPGYPEAFPSADMEDPLAVEIGYGSSLLFQGASAAMSYTLQNAEEFYELVNNVEQAAPDTPAGDKLKFIRLIAKQSQQYGQRIVDVASKVSAHELYPGDPGHENRNSQLGGQLKVVSKLIAGGSRTPVYMVRIGGFDTHDAQVLDNHSEGEHAILLKDLNDSIASFMKDLEFHGVADKVLGMTFSEFGRTILSNASNGTDHGTAAPMFFFGNAVRGGVTGRNPVIDRFMSYEDNLPHEFEFRQLYNSVLDQWFGIEAESRNAVLFGDYESVEIIGDPAITLSVRSEFDLSVFPNPMNGQSTIRYEGDGKPVQLALLDLNGRVVQNIFTGVSTPGMNSYRWDTSTIPNGRYFVLLRSDSGRQVFSVMK